MIKKAVVLIAGYGVRCLPFSKAIPKTMLSVVYTPIIQLIVDELIKSDIKEILFVTSGNGNIVQNHFSKNVDLEEFLINKNKKDLYQNLKNIENSANYYFMQSKRILGSGDAVLSTKNWVGDEPFIVLCGDEFFINKKPVIKQLIEEYEKTSKSIIALKEVNDKDREKYGIVEGECVNKLVKINNLIEKPKMNQTKSNIAIMGRYLLTPDIFDYLEKIKPTVNGEYQLTDALNVKSKEKNDILGLLYEGKRYDCGNKLDYMKTNVEMALCDEEISKDFKEFLIQIINRNEE